MFYAKTSDWLAAEAKKVAKQIDDIDQPYIPGQKWQRIKQREVVLSELRRERRRLERAAERLRARGD